MWPELGDAMRAASREYKRKFGVVYPEGMWWEPPDAMIAHAKRCIAEGKPITEEEIEAARKKYADAVF
jgi:hypothetical protein